MRHRTCTGARVPQVFFLRGGPLRIDIGRGPARAARYRQGGPKARGLRWRCPLAGPARGTPWAGDDSARDGGGPRGSLSASSADVLSASHMSIGQCLSAFLSSSRGLPTCVPTYPLPLTRPGPALSANARKRIGHAPSCHDHSASPPTGDNTRRGRRGHANASRSTGALPLSIAPPPGEGGPPTLTLPARRAPRVLFGQLGSPRVRNSAGLHAADPPGVGSFSRDEPLEARARWAPLRGSARVLMCQPRGR